MTTVALSAASRREISFPRLRIPPVTTATFLMPCPGFPQGRGGREAIAFCSSGRRTAPDAFAVVEEPEHGGGGRFGAGLPVPAVGAAGRTSPIFTFATGPGAVPSVFAFRINARSMASVATAGRSIAWKTCTRFRSRIVGTPERSGPHQDDRAVRPVPVHAALGLPAKEPGINRNGPRAPSIRHAADSSAAVSSPRSR